jgi:hypothetical protein
MNHANFGQPVSSVPASLTAPGAAVAPSLASTATFGLLGLTRFPAGDSGSSRQLQLSTKLTF